MLAKNHLSPTHRHTHPSIAIDTINYQNTRQQQQQQQKKILFFHQNKTKQKKILQNIEFNKMEPEMQAKNKKKTKIKFALYVSSISEM